MTTGRAGIGSTHVVFHVLRYRRMWKKALVLVGLVGVAVLVFGAAASPIASGIAESLRAREPVTQYADKFETSRHENLADLFSTLFEGHGFQPTWNLLKLPCSVGVYRLATSEASVVTSQSSGAEVAMHLNWFNLPHGMGCGSRLPAGSSQGAIKIMVVSRAATAEMHSPPVIYRGGGIQLESNSSCVTLAQFCPGSYLVMISVEAFCRPLWFVYEFTVTTIARPKVRSLKIRQ
jgi:hypothetical protein